VSNSVKAASDASGVDAKGPIVIDLGKQRRKRTKDLRRGRGRLMDEVNLCLEELKTAGTISGSAQPVIVVVREKRRRRTGFLPGF
jgi:hypothetical protein